MRNARAPTPTPAVPIDPAATDSVLRKLATVVVSVVGSTLAVLLSLFAGLLATVVGWIPPRGNWMLWVARVWSRLVLWVCFIRVRVRYEAGLAPTEAYVFMVNHQSFFDIPALLVTLPGQTRFLAKRSLFRIPIFGWGMHAGGFVPVDRKDRSTARATFAAALDRLRRGHSVLVFPEETRSADGSLLPFKSGGFLLALKTGYSIVPVGIEGSRAVRPKGSWRIRPGTVEVRYGAPIPVTGTVVRRRGELVAEVRANVARLAGLPVD